MPAVSFRFAAYHPYPPAGHSPKGSNRWTPFWAGLSQIVMMRRNEQVLGAYLVIAKDLPDKNA